MMPGQSIAATAAMSCASDSNSRQVTTTVNAAPAAGPAHGRAGQPGRAGTGCSARRGFEGHGCCPRRPLVPMIGYGRPPVAGPRVTGLAYAS